MKIRLPGNLSPFSILWSMCFVLFMTASVCASTNIPTTPSEPTDAPSYAFVYKGDHVLVYTKDDRTLHMIVTENNSERQTITGRATVIERLGRGTLFYKQDNTLGSSPVYKSSVDVSFSEIEYIEIKEPKDGWPIPIDGVDPSSKRGGEHFKLILFIICGPLCSY